MIKNKLKQKYKFRQVCKQPITSEHDSKHQQLNWTPNQMQRDQGRMHKNTNPNRINHPKKNNPNQNTLRSTFCAQCPVHSHHTRPSRSTFLERYSNSTKSNLQSTQNTFAQAVPQS